MPTHNKHKCRVWMTTSTGKTPIYWAECGHCGWGPILKYDEADRDTVVELHENPEEAMKLRAPVGHA